MVWTCGHINSKHRNNMSIIQCSTEPFLYQFGSIFQWTFCTCTTFPYLHCFCTVFTSVLSVSLLATHHNLSNTALQLPFPMDQCSFSHKFSKSAISTDKKHVNICEDYGRNMEILLNHDPTLVKKQYHRAPYYWSIIPVKVYYLQTVIHHMHNTNYHSLWNQAGTINIVTFILIMHKVETIFTVTPINISPWLEELFRNPSTLCCKAFHHQHCRTALSEPLLSCIHHQL